MFPAVDIGAGRAIGTVTMTLTLWSPVLSIPKEAGLLWYPTDQGAERGTIEIETRDMLRYLIQESQEIKPLFTDMNDRPVFRGDWIRLSGLKAVQYNEVRGIIKGPDPDAAGRFAIQLSRDPNNCKSFKQQNIAYMGHVIMHDVGLRVLREEGKETEFYHGLLDRSRELDIFKRDTWSNVEEVHGTCALVTCTSLLTCLGYRAPTAWQDTMQVAAELILHVDGYLLQYDAVGYADFGNDMVMQSFADEASLGLKLENSGISPNSEHGDRKRKVMLWRKLKDAFELVLLVTTIYESASHSRDTRSYRNSIARQVAGDENHF